MTAVLLLLSLLATPAHPQATMEPQVNALGGVDRLALGDVTLAQGVMVRIIKPEWQGAWGMQHGGGGLSVEGLPVDAPTTFAGHFDCEGNPCEFEQRIERGAPGEDFVRLTYRLTPSADLDTELVVVTVDLPIAGNAGVGEFIVSDGQSILRKGLPETLPDPYHIIGARQIEWAAWLLPGDVGLRLEPDGAGITGVSFQDNRQFQGDVYQAQFAVRDTRGLRAGHTYEFGLTMRPFTRADLAAEQGRMVELARDLEVPMTSDEPLALRGVALSATDVAQHELLELDLDLSAAYDNPFDPEDIDVTATFTGPEGRVMRVPGFFCQDYDRVPFGDGFRMERRGEPGWKVRFAAPVEGDWQVTVTVRDRSGEVASEPVAFTCLPGDDPGYVRRVPGNPYYLQFDNGEPYFAVGPNVCWSRAGHTEQYEEWFRALGAAGGNYARIWLVRWNMALEWTNQGHRSGLYYGLGRYSTDNAWLLDRVMGWAREHGIRVMLCLGYHGEFMETPDYFRTYCWHDNPYNVANGGPCETPADFWTNEAARRFYQNRLRYYIARWGWDTHVLSWQFWNEVHAPAPWIEEMGRYFRAHDPYAHLVTTTYGNDEVWRLDEMDYALAHTYGSDESRPRTVPHIAPLGRDHTTRFGKPFMVGEFGIDWKASDAKHDPAGLGTSMHDGMWASIMTRCFGAASLWWWDNYIHPNDLYHKFTAVRRFADTVPWPELAFDFAEFGPTHVPVSPDARWADVIVIGTLGWQKATETDFTVNPDGTVSHGAAFSGTLFSDSKKDLKSALRFHVTYPQDGKFIFRVGTVSAGAVLHVRVDGEEVWRRELPAGPGEGEWKSTRYYEQWGIWQSVYDTEFEAPIPAGRRVIEIENTGADWVSVGPYRFTGCRDPQFATLDQLGLHTEDYAILWLHDPESNWHNDLRGIEPAEMAGITTSLLGLRDGAYRVEWWDTRAGEVILEVEAESADGALPLAPPTFTRDIAAKVVRR